HRISAPELVHKGLLLVTHPGGKSGQIVRGDGHLDRLVLAVTHEHVLTDNGKLDTVSSSATARGFDPDFVTSSSHPRTFSVIRNGRPHLARSFGTWSQRPGHRYNLTT